MRISDWSSDLCSSDLYLLIVLALAGDSTMSRFLAMGNYAPQARKMMRATRQARTVFTAPRTAAIGPRSTLFRGALFSEHTAWRACPALRRSDAGIAGKDSVSTGRSRWLRVPTK